MLSPSTEAYDGGRKLEHYTTIPSLRHYILVATNNISVHVYTREDGQWLLTTYARADLYADVIPSP